MVEDDEMDAELVRLELERGGFELIWERVDTEETLRHMLTTREWDLIISDFAMPKFDGLRAFEVFRQTGIDTPFIFVSGALGEDRAVAAMRAGARDYFLKGNLTRLSAAVERELREAASRQRRATAEEAARRQQVRLAMAVEASGAGVFEHRIPAGGDSYLSERSARILGYDQPPPAPDVYEYLLEHVHPDDRPAVERAYEDFLAGHEETLVMDYRVRRAGGDVADVTLYAKALTRDAGGRAEHVVGVMMDVTDRRKLEAQLIQSQKMEAVGRLAGGVAHDFNNILTAILSFGSFVLEELEPGSPLHEDMEEVISAGKKAAALTAQLLAFSRRKAISPRVVNLTALVRDLNRMLRRVVGEDIDVAINLSDDLWNVRLDPGSFEQVLVNLAVNARDAMPHGGKLTIETRNTEIAAGHARAELDPPTPGQYVLVSVSDDGTGMSPETQRLIFEPFFTTKEAGKGTGLGLSTCFGIVHQAGGRLSVYSELGVGTTFRVYLPRAREEVDTTSPTSAALSVRGSETVLVAEDDDQVRRLAVRALSALGYRVIEAANGQEAVVQSERTGHEIDLLLTDVVMPEMSGKQLAERLLAQRSALRVLYMSGYTANAIAHRGVLDPGTHLIEKPFTPDSLARKVREVLDG